MKKISSFIPVHVINKNGLWIKDVFDNQTSIINSSKINNNFLTDTFIGKNCFIAVGAIILPGVKIGDEVNLNMFFDSKTFAFKLKFLGKEYIKTKFGRIKTIKFRPIVQSGRVFKESESVTIWVTDDKNKIPVRLKAALAVGSLRAELKAFKGLANSFKIMTD